MVDSSKIGMMPQRPMSASVCSNRSSSGSFGMSFNSRIPMPKSSTVMNSRYGEIIILAKLPVAKLVNSDHGAK